MKIPVMRIYSNESGFSLVEVLIALIVLSIGVVATNLMQVTSVKGNADAFYITQLSWRASNEAEKIINSKNIEKLRYIDDTEDSVSYDYQKTVALDSNGNGENTGKSGLDDGNPLVLLDSDTTNDVHAGYSPDDSDTTDSNYTILRNVAPDYPIRHTLTVRIIVVHNRTGKAVAFDYLKFDPDLPSY